jgi:hypothetical protein
LGDLKFSPGGGLLLEQKKKCATLTINCLHFDELTSNHFKALRTLSTPLHAYSERKDQ